MAKKKGKKSQPLTQEEIWDDSALVRSWNEAVEEYNLYHSIHARGENIDEVLRRAESEEAKSTMAATLAQEQKQSQPVHVKGSESQSREVEDGEISDGEVHDSEKTLPLPDSTGTDAAEQKTGQRFPSMPNGSATATQVPAPGPPSMPQELLSGQNEGLKNLMMAWYWAGYYTRQAEEQKREVSS